MEVDILGPLRVLDGTRVVDPGTTKQRLVLAMLAVARGRPVPADVLIDQLWGESSPATAQGTLQGYIANLRRALEPDRAPRTPARVLVSAPTGYILALDADALDADRFERLARAGREQLSGGLTAAAADTLRSALLLWRGEPLDEAAGADWAAAESARLVELRLAATEDLAEARLALGEHDHLVGELQGLLTDHPLRERLRGLLMLALYRAGRQADALAVYRDGRERLADELGIDPSPALQALEADLLNQAPHLAAPLPPAPAAAASPSAVAATGLAAQRPTSRPARAAGEATPAGVGLVGRDEELGVALDALERARAGTGQVLLVHGEPGIGKTRLVEELRRRAKPVLVVQGRCVDAEGVPPFWPWVQVLGALPAAVQSGGLDVDGEDALAATAARFNQALRIAERLHAAAGDAGCVVVLEDVNWADPASLDLLHLVAGELADAPVLLLATYRDVGTPSAPLKAALGHLARLAGTRHLPLRGLDEAAVGALAAQTTGALLDDADAVALTERSGGNPFFVTELLRWSGGRAGGAEALPAGVRDVLRLRLAQLPSTAAGALGVGAVIGRDFPLHLVEAVTGGDSDELLAGIEAAVDTGLLVEPAPGRLRFAHALVREVLLEQLSAARRARVHAKVLAALQTRHGDHAAALALHAHAAAVGGADVPDAAALCLRAAAEALDRLAYEDAAATAERGLELDDVVPVDPAVRCDLLLVRADAATRLGDLAAAAAAIDEADRLARDLDDAERLAFAALRSAGGGFGLFWSLSWGTATSSETALRRLRDAHARSARLPAELAVAVTALLAATLALRCESAEADRLSLEALEQARELGGVALLRALRGRLVASWNPRGFAERLGLADELIARAGTHRTAELTGRYFRIHALLEHGDVDGCDAELVRFEQRAAELRMVDHEMAAGWVRACLLVLQGRLSDAEALAAALAGPRPGMTAAAANILSSAISSVRGIGLWLQGRMAEMGANAEATAAEADAHPGWLLITALALADTGAVDRAAELLAAAMPLDADRDLDAIDTVANAWLQAEVALSVGDAERARVLHDLLLPLADRLVVFSPDATCHGSFELTIGSLAAVCGDLDEAAERLRRAIHANERARAHPYAALAHRRLAGVLAARGDTGDAEAAIRHATAAQRIADELDLPGVAGPFTLRGQPARA